MTMEAENIASLSLPTHPVEIPMREPDQEGPSGRAWLLPAPPAQRMEHAASIGTWLVNVPDAHQFWEWWIVSVVHLRAGDHLPPATLDYDGAEYEFTIFTVDPDESPDPDPEITYIEGVRFLSPPDVVEQFHGVADGDAARIAHVAVQAIVAGDISPDSDHRPRWKVLLDATVKAFQAGHHVLN
jgi:hypothetical protein